MVSKQWLKDFLDWSSHKFFWLAIECENECECECENNLTDVVFERKQNRTKMTPEYRST